MGTFLSKRRWEGVFFVPNAKNIFLKTTDFLQLALAAKFFAVSFNTGKGIKKNKTEKDKNVHKDAQGLMSPGKMKFANLILLILNIYLYIYNILIQYFCWKILWNKLLYTNT